MQRLAKLGDCLVNGVRPNQVNITDVNNCVISQRFTESDKTEIKKLSEQNRTGTGKYAREFEAKTASK